jgi:hypothetical protein
VLIPSLVDRFEKEVKAGSTIYADLAEPIALLKNGIYTAENSIATH